MYFVTHKNRIIQYNQDPLHHITDNNPPSDDKCMNVSVCSLFLCVLTKVCDIITSIIRCMAYTYFVIDVYHKAFFKFVYLQNG